MIEAGLIVGIVLAATKGVPQRGLWVTYACIFGGTAGACLVALFASQIAALFEGEVQELFDAGILLLAVGMLTWHDVWMASHGRVIAQETRAVGSGCLPKSRSPPCPSYAAWRCSVKDQRVVLFLFGIAASGGTSAIGMLVGGALGVLAGAGCRHSCILAC